MNLANTRIFNMSFASVYPLYVLKVQKKGRTKAELDQVITWLTGFNKTQLQHQIKKQTTFKEFFAKAKLNPNAKHITGVICGYRVEDIQDKLMQKIRYLDKVVDELAQGKALEKIMRKGDGGAAVDAYIAALPKNAQAKLKQLRQLVLSLAPGAVEKIGYKMPMYSLFGRPLVGFAAWEKHIGFYGWRGDFEKKNKKLLKGYKTSAGTVQFPLDKALPVALIKKLILSRIKENSAKM